MHLVEQYALSCGVKIDKPHIEVSYFPVVPQKYITIHSSNRIQSKTYDLYKDALELINPFLEKANIKIIQIGETGEEKLPYCQSLLGRTNIKQAAFVIKNSILHLSTDSFSTHVASGFEKKIVSLYSTSYKECCGPYWGNKSDHILLEPDRDKHKASFSDTENPKTINEIMPEKIAQGVLDLLDLKHNINDIETFHVGQMYHGQSVAIVPDHTMPQSFIQGQPVNIWGHAHFNEENIIKWAINRKSNIFIDKPLNTKYLNTIKNNIHQINFFLNDENENCEQFFSDIKKIGIRLQLICEDKEKIKTTRLKFFDWDVHLLEKTTKKDLDNVDKLCNNSRYKSSQLVCSNKKIYASKAAWKNSIEGDHKEIIDCPEFWEDLVNLKIYNDYRNDK